jgi:hypothetical protein
VLPLLNYLPEKILWFGKLWLSQLFAVPVFWSWWKELTKHKMKRSR